MLHERGIEISHETVRFWWNRFGLVFAAEIRLKWISRMCFYSNWRWHLDEVFVKINGETSSHLSDSTYRVIQAPDAKLEILAVYGDIE